MKKNNYILFCSLLAGLTVMSAGNALGGIRVGNLSRNYAGSYKNVAALEQQYYDSVANTQDTVVDIELPVRVADKELAEKIRSGDQDVDADYNTLNNCAMIYPDGEFVWDVPTLGRGAGGAPTCVSVVEMRVLGANGAYEYTTVARGKLAAGDAINCNISDFPQSTYLPAVMQVTFPADNAPTHDDVVHVLNEEQKNKAGLKIAAATVVAGLAGNIVGRQEPGKDGLFGTNSEKMKTTLGGAALGAALMTASTYSGKVAGDTILHAGVNAAAGGIVGNMMATGDSILRVQKCNDGGVEKTCLWGSIVKTEALSDPDKVYYYCPKGAGTVVVCDKTKNDADKPCTINNSLIAKSIEADIENKTYRPEEFNKDGHYDVFLSGKATPYKYDSETKTMTTNVDSNSEYCYIANVEKRAGAPISAVIVGFEDTSAFGTKYADWGQWKNAHKSDARICRRDGHGNPTDCDKLADSNGKPYTIDDFNPLKMEASDGGVVDFSNKARLGSTIKGAGVGGALGGFSGYQGAQNDIEERFVEATREYNDSLEKIYCGTGKKFLTFYNDVVSIPAAQE
ncbi:MAG: hypothetical protein J6Y07_01185 [Alphaproteobacteria bacterium]|nr:hypothetical protein [Alphaproteobacteria bacterium]